MYLKSHMLLLFLAFPKPPEGQPGHLWSAETDLESLRFLSDLKAVGGRKGRAGAERTPILIQLFVRRPRQWNEEASVCSFTSSVETSSVIAAMGDVGNLML